MNQHCVNLHGVNLHEVYRRAVGWNAVGMRMRFARKGRHVHIGVRSRGLRDLPGRRLPVVIALGPRRQHIAVVAQLGGEMARPAGRIPAGAMRGDIGFVVDHGQRRIRQQALELVEHRFDAGFQRDQHRVRIQRAQRGFVGVRRIDGDQQLGPRLSQRFGEVIGGFARARQQYDARHGGLGDGVNHRTSPVSARWLPTARTRCA